jgi:hypothetical protein
MKDFAGRPASEILPHWESITGLSENTARAVTRKLTEDEILPRSRGGKAQALLGPKDVATIMIGSCIAVDAPIRDISKLTPIYCALRSPNGDRLVDVVASWIETFGSAKDSFDRKDASNDNLVAMLALRSRIQIDIGFPSASITTETKDGQLEITFGPQDQPSTFVRAVKSVTISGKILFRLAMGLYFDQRPADTAEAA